MAQIYNPELVRNLAPYFHKRSDLALNHAHSIAFIRNIPGLLGFWPTAERDISGNNNDLTRSGTIKTILYDRNIVPYAQFDSAGSAYAFSPEPAPPLSEFDIIGDESYVGTGSHGLTMGGWWQQGSDGVAESLMSKWDTTGTPSHKAYRMYLNAANNIQFSLSIDGTALYNQNSASSSPVDTWFYAVGRWEPSTETKIYYGLAADSDLTIKSKTASVPATIHDSTDAFAIGSINSGATQFLNGRSSMTFLVRGRIPEIYIETIFDLTSPLFAAT